MTVITVNTAENRLSLDQRRVLSETLTDAVLVPEVGQFAPAARAGFQVHFVERRPDMMAIGGRLLADAELDVMMIDVAVMDGDWRQEVRTQVIERLLAAMADACGLPRPHRRGGSTSGSSTRAAGGRVVACSPSFRCWAPVCSRRRRWRRSARR
jgi:hypothetical protein